jgi:hypothetical protein
LAQSEQFLQRAGVLVGLAKVVFSISRFFVLFFLFVVVFQELGEEGECKRCTALLFFVF